MLTDTQIWSSLLCYCNTLKQKDRYLAQYVNYFSTISYHINDCYRTCGSIYDVIPIVNLQHGTIEKEDYCYSKFLGVFVGTWVGTLTKKNWEIIDTINGATSSAIIYSIAETAKANNLKPYEYFEYLLTQIPAHMDDTDRSFPEDLLP